MSTKVSRFTLGLAFLLVAHFMWRSAHGPFDVILISFLLVCGAYHLLVWIAMLAATIAAIWIRIRAIRP
jgi:hypothetical protein